MTMLTTGPLTPEKTDDSFSMRASRNSVAEHIFPNRIQPDEIRPSRKAMNAIPWQDAPERCSPPCGPRAAFGPHKARGRAAVDFSIRILRFRQAFPMFLTSARAGNVKKHDMTLIKNTLITMLFDDNFLKNR
jgi:hypothetical protein